MNISTTAASSHEISYGYGDIVEGNISGMSYTYLSLYVCGLLLPGKVGLEDVGGEGGGVGIPCFLSEKVKRRVEEVRGGRRGCKEWGVVVVVVFLRRRSNLTLFDDDKV